MEYCLIEKVQTVMGTHSGGFNSLECNCVEKRLLEGKFAQKDE